MHDAGQIARRHLGSELHPRLEQSIHGRDDEIAPIPGLEKTGRGGHGRCGVRIQPAHVGEPPACPGLADGQRLDPHRAAAGKLGGDVHNPVTVRRAGERTLIRGSGDDGGVRRAERLDCVELGRQELAAPGLDQERARQELRSLAARMQIQGRIAHREQHRRHVVCNREGRRAARISRIRPVHVAAVNRGHPRVLDHGRIVEGRHDDQPAMHPLGIELSDQPPRDDLSFVLVTVIAGGDQRGGSLSTADARDRHGDESIGVAVVRMLDLEPADPAPR